MDDNITLNVSRFKEPCGAIIAEVLNDTELVIQASVAGIVQEPSLAACMGEADFVPVFPAQMGVTRSARQFHQA